MKKYFVELRFILNNLEERKLFVKFLKDYPLPLDDMLHGFLEEK